MVPCHDLSIRFDTQWFHVMILKLYSIVPCGDDIVIYFLNETQSHRRSEPKGFPINLGTMPDSIFLKVYECQKIYTLRVYVF